jgi:chemotaxis signal transduction protein
MTAISSHQVLTFSLGTENFGVDILRVQEIRGWSPVTRIPKVPPHVLGVLNLRGVAIGAAADVVTLASIAKVVRRLTDANPASRVEKDRF